MKDITSIETLDVPEGVTVNIKARTITVEGPRGTLTKKTSHVQMDIQLVSVHGYIFGIGGARRGKSTAVWREMIGRVDGNCAGGRGYLRRMVSSTHMGRCRCIGDEEVLCGAEDERRLPCSYPSSFPLLTSIPYCPHTHIQVKRAQGTQVVFTVFHGGRKHVACLRTIKSLVENMITGVTKVSPIFTRLGRMTLTSRDSSTKCDWSTHISPSTPLSVTMDLPSKSETSWERSLFETALCSREPRSHCRTSKMNSSSKETISKRSLNQPLPSPTSAESRTRISESSWMVSSELQHHVCAASAGVGEAIGMRRVLMSSISERTTVVQDEI